jgi:hypothetical protein
VGSSEIAAGPIGNERRVPQTGDRCEWAPNRDPLWN